MRNEHEESVNPPVGGLLLQEVGSREEDTKGHLKNTEQDGKLHLEGIVVVEFVGASLPHVVHTEGVDSTVKGEVGSSCEILIGEVNTGGQVPTTLEKSHGNAEKLVVDETTIDGIERHDEKHKATIERHLDDLQ